MELLFYSCNLGGVVLVALSLRYSLNPDMGSLEGQDVFKPVGPQLHSRGGLCSWGGLGRVVAGKPPPHPPLFSFSLCVACGQGAA